MMPVPRGPREAYFQGLGTGWHVPEFLRIKGRVRNRNMRPQELGQLVRQIWAAKEEFVCASTVVPDIRQRLIYCPPSLQERTRTLAVKPTLRQFFYEYLRNRFGIQSIVCEWAYSVLCVPLRVTLRPCWQAASRASATAQIRAGEARWRCGARTFLARTEWLHQ